MMPDVTKPFILKTDTSKWAVRATLMQKDENDQLHPCGYLSHALMPTKQNWQIYDRELGAEHPITVHCDHKNLTYY